MCGLCDFNALILLTSVDGRSIQRHELAKERTTGA